MVHWATSDLQLTRSSEVTSASSHDIPTALVSDECVAPSVLGLHSTKDSNVVCEVQIDKMAINHPREP